MLSEKVPICTEDVRSRAAKKLSGFNASKKSNKHVKTVAITGDLVKPIHVKKTEPLVKRITYFENNS
ncbi:hypothetical protein [Psychrobacillus sp. MER TA 171]|uniref:hypothetical protein n=1 Tax=Psychrobacillus sp. MER TA 171 TaxID=2939577 RepID=UPI00204135B4|nr:hypothetical protein [Psychrobacillus sp. MER TA 171]MCM3357275.1 hypothetical protein [Psychrobacillus sp. MER TA 171]